MAAEETGTCDESDDIKKHVELTILEINLTNYSHDRNQNIPSPHLPRLAFRETASTRGVAPSRTVKTRAAVSRMYIFFYRQVCFVERTIMC